MMLREHTQLQMNGLWSLTNPQMATELNYFEVEAWLGFFII